MNNKGFAITTMLYGTFVIFLMLMFVMLGIISTYKENMEKLIEGSNGAREITKLECSKVIEDPDGDGVYTAGTGYSLTAAQIDNIKTICGY